MYVKPTGPEPQLREPHVVTGWAPCLRALSKPDLVSDPYLVGLEPNPTNNLLLMEGDQHKRVRRLVAPYFAPGRLERLREPLSRLAVELVGAVADKPDPDLVAEVVQPLVLDGILSAMEVPDGRRAKLAELAKDMLGWLEPDLTPEERARVNNAALRAAALFTRDRAEGKATGLHATLETAAREGKIPEKIARSTPVVVLHGGYENPLYHLGSLVSWAVSDPERFATLARSAPQRIPDEILRVFSPVRRVARWATAEGNGEDFLPTRKGDMLWIDLQSAHNDRERFACPHVDVSHQQRHLGFGYGRHGCPGSALARLEGELLISALLAIPADQLGQFEVQWHRGVVAQGPAKITRRSGQRQRRVGVG
jgi:cytochrome P450